MIHTQTPTGVKSFKFNTIFYFQTALFPNRWCVRFKYLLRQIYFTGENVSEQKPPKQKTSKQKPEQKEKEKPKIDVRKAIEQFRGYVQEKKKELEELEKKIEELEQKRISIIEELNEIYDTLGLPRISARRGRGYSRKNWMGTPMYQRARKFALEYREKHGEPPTRQEVIDYLVREYGYSERSGSFSPVLALLRDEGLIKPKR